MLKVVLVGRPNVGKSTLFNRLVRSQKAIVNDQPELLEIGSMGREISRFRIYINRHCWD